MTVDVQVDLSPLLAELGDDVVVTDPDRMDKYRWDRANDPDAGIPLAVVRAESTEQVQAAV
ncbi:MAG TPA: FAD-binding oxidoreductase, partial [Nocardioides sp.]|nr:FAD-binding oxidoreductase [Nocardioides sp.]